MLPLRLGLCVPKGKATRMNLPDRILEACKKANIKVVNIDVEKCIDAQGPFDFILHKILDHYNDKEVGVEKAEQKIDDFVEYTKTHPEIIVVDNLEFCWRLTNRKLMIDLIRKCTFTLKDINVFLPKTLDVAEKYSFTNIKAEMNERYFQFPVVVKPYSAYFDNGAHLMSLVFNMDGLKKIKKPCLIQEFCNHSGKCYKVFVIGTRYHICERPSIQNLNEKMSELRTNSNIVFNSFQVSKTGQQFHEELHGVNPNQRCWMTSDEKSDLLDSEIIEEIITRMHNISGLYLYGFDILVERETNNYALIDINQFPSYKDIDQSHFANDLVFLLKSLKNQ